MNNDGNYEPKNCRWATAQQQQSNKSNSRLLTVGNETTTLAEWSRRSGVPTSTILNRIKAGRSIDVAVSAGDLRVPKVSRIGAQR